MNNDDPIAYATVPIESRGEDRVGSTSGATESCRSGGGFVECFRSAGFPNEEAREPVVYSIFLGLLPILVTFFIGAVVKPQTTNSMC